MVHIVHHVHKQWHQYTHMHSHTYTHIECNPHTQSITTHLQTHTHIPESKHMKRGSTETGRHAKGATCWCLCFSWLAFGSHSFDVLGLEEYMTSQTYTFNNYIDKQTINMPMVRGTTGRAGPDICTYACVAWDTKQHLYTLLNDKHD